MPCFVFVGGNDIFDATTALETGPSGATSVAIIQPAVSAIRDNIMRLRQNGAEHFLTGNGTDISLVRAIFARAALPDLFTDNETNHFNHR